MNTEQWRHVRMWHAAAVPQDKVSTRLLYLDLD